MYKDQISVDSPEFELIFTENQPLIDVRAPIEFQQGSLPGAINLPILNDEERALIGTLYKKEGQQAAIARGYELVSGSIKKARVDAWIEFIKKNPTTVLYCFRGGKRSQITQKWLAETGTHRPLLRGGYKQARNFFMSTIDNFSTHTEMLALTGPTGSGKTKLIEEIQNIYPTLNLEKMAQHRGSAFGSQSLPQPTQIDFENKLGVAILKMQKQNPQQQRPLVEDESRLIGQRQIPGAFFECLRHSAVIWVEEPLDCRVQNIFNEYILDTSIGKACLPEAAANETAQMEAKNLYLKYKKSLWGIQRKLGGLRTQEISKDMEDAESCLLEKHDLEPNKIWIEKLLRYYYDPLYLNSLAKRNPQILFRGRINEVTEFMKLQLKN